MYVHLLSVTDNRESAWKHSRKLAGDANVDMEEMERTPFSLHSLKRYTFEVEMARVMLDLIVNFTKDIWSQSSRINPIEDLVIDIASDVALEKLTQLKVRAMDGEPMDIIRLGSPILTRLGWCFSMDHRTLIGFLKSLKFYQPRLFDYYGTAILAEIGMSVSALEESPFGELIPQDFDTSIFDGKYEHEGVLYNEGIGYESYNYISQLNRHADTYILSELWFMPWLRIEQTVMSDKIKFCYVIGKNVYNKHILSHRACWIADWNHWSDRVKKIYPDASSVKSILPCHGCGEKCVFKADLKARIEHKDPNLPCPLVTGNLSDIDKRGSDEPKSEYLINVFKELTGYES